MHHAPLPLFNSWYTSTTAHEHMGRFGSIVPLIRPFWHDQAPPWLHNNLARRPCPGDDLHTAAATMMSGTESIEYEVGAPHWPRPRL